MPQCVEIAGIAVYPGIGQGGDARLLAEDDLVFLQSGTDNFLEDFRTDSPFEKEVGAGIFAERPVEYIGNSQLLRPTRIGVRTFDNIIAKINQRFMQSNYACLDLLPGTADPFDNDKFPFSHCILL